MAETVKVDILICGAGPVGLLLAYQLKRMGHSIYIIDRHDAEKQSMFGRATSLFPRTLEMLDQLDLLEEMNQIGVIGRSSVTFKDGKRLASRGWHSMFTEMGETYLDYILNIRQKFSMDVFRRRYQKLGGLVGTEWTLKEMEIHEKDAEHYRVTSMLHGGSGGTKVVKSKYIIGADGGRSTVRQLAGIDFNGEERTYRWVRIDGIFKTNMPDAEIGFNAIESKKHGNVLWVQLEHGVQRIGFALNSEMYAKYGDTMTIEQASAEAKEAMAPFTFEIERVEWWTLYKIQQKIAMHFVSGPVLLAGDSCHTHSSGAAQGMNTGMHDATNLGWKLGGVLGGWLKEEILKTYESERRTAAQTLIDLDEDFSTCLSGHVPERHAAMGADPNEVFFHLFQQSIQFNIGIGIEFAANILNVDPHAGMVTAGKRGPDCLLRAPGSHIPTRLFQVTKNTGIFSVIVFAGQPHLTASAVRSLRRVMDSKTTPLEMMPRGSFRLLTIIAGYAMNADTALGVEKFGDAYYDVDHTAHAKYHISTSRGAIVILRPDGILGTAVDLDEPGIIAQYFSAFTRT
ncbi:pentachlorophenol 4-monooxygenase [Rhizodiscina lignyota]|uniref:Pentachlorophenol 4-monooxygenase n=1 Tax=Rhizodiscina lignyota TaxID=1504668 RepID=A0A9P4M5F8_9PEZI|nr:pentachlorophenol 4-monooxygenase [Rhizodiscina lignyota]